MKSLIQRTPIYRTVHVLGDEDTIVHDLISNAYVLLIAVLVDMPLNIIEYKSTSTTHLPNI